MLVVSVLILLFALLIIRVPVGFAVGIAGAVGLYLYGGLPVVIGVLETTPLTAVSAYSLTAIPMFILMAQFVFLSGVAGNLFESARAWVGRTPAGLGVSTTLAGALFAAISGSSTASAATLSSTAIPEMTKQGYDPRLASGLVAVVGTLAVMIPPSIVLVFYAILAEQSVGQLLIAGFLPGALITVALILTCLVLVWRNPSLAPAGHSYSLREKLRTLPAAGPVIVLFILVTGLIYFGVATPTEAAALGAFGALIIAVLSGKLSWQQTRAALLETITSSVMILMIILSAFVFGYFLTATQVTQNLVAFVGGLPAPPLAIFGIIAVIYIILGFFLDQIAILALTIPVVLPVIEGLGFDPIWFGIMVVLLVEIGLVTPPLGLNVFVVARTAGRSNEEVFRGVTPFVISMLALVVLFALFPGLILWVPETMSQ